MNLIELLQFERSSKSDTIHKYLDKRTDIGTHVGMWLGNNQGNFQLHRFTKSRNITTVLWRLLF